MGMFGFVFRKAQATVDNAIDQVVNGVIMAVPFILAFAFATAALAVWIHQQLDPALANLVLAAIFAVAGGIAALALRTRPGPLKEDAEREDGAQAAGEPRPFTDADRELFMSTATKFGPIAVPFLMRNFSRIVPILLALVAAGFVIYRTLSEPDSSEPGGRETAAEPAE